MYLRVDVPVLYTANPFAAAAAQPSGVTFYKRNVTKLATQRILPLLRITENGLR